MKRYIRLLLFSSTLLLASIMIATAWANYGYQTTLTRWCDLMQSREPLGGAVHFRELEELVAGMPARTEVGCGHSVELIRFEWWGGISTRSIDVTVTSSQDNSEVLFLQTP